MRWSASLKRPARAFGSSSNLRPLGEARRTTFLSEVGDYLQILVAAHLLSMNAIPVGAHPGYSDQTRTGAL
jgi:hypothetical protein